MRYLLALFFSCILSACGGSGASSGSPVPGEASSSSSSTSSSSSSTSSGAMANLVSRVSYYQDLIVFELLEDYAVGQFANGDYWVHNNGNDVVITAITPASRTLGGRTINGAMVNPAVSSEQGYDSSPRDMTYTAELNRDPGITGQALVLPPGSSVIKAISMESDAGRPIISDAAVLTVLDSEPPAGSFRPVYTGENKTIPANVSDMDYAQLANFTRLGSEPSIEELTAAYSRVWLEHCDSWLQRDIHPQNNMPVYGRYIATRTAEAALALQLNYSQQEKEQLLIGLVQYGLDLYALVSSGIRWDANGGHNMGRKLPILLAGRVLQSDTILAYADAEQYLIFHEDQQSFYVSQAEVDMTHSAEWAPDDRADPIPYELSDIGMPEWGIRHADKPSSDNRNWETPYRFTNGYPHTIQALAVRMMAAEGQWNRPALFDYTDRFFEVERDEFSDYLVSLWDTYRDEL